MAQKAQQSTSRGIRVAVYGTLKRGHGNHYLLANPNVAFLGRTILTGPYHMVSLGGFPAVVRSPDVKLQNRILCEVYRIDEETLEALDILESNGQFYTRDQVVTPWK